MGRMGVNIGGDSGGERMWPGERGGSLRDTEWKARRKRGESTKAQGARQAQDPQGSAEKQMELPDWVV